MRLTVSGWGRLVARLDEARIHSWLSQVASEGEAAFRAGLEGGHSGRIYRRRGGRVHQASAPGEYPANDSGGLIASLRSESSNREAKIGTNQYYSHYLRSGTSKMARRKMSDDALREGIDRAAPAARGFVSWARR